MSAPPQERIAQLCGEFRLPTVAAEVVPRFQASDHGAALATLLEVFELEASDRRQRRVDRLRRAAKLPAGKTWETLIEVLAQNGKLHPIQEAFWENHGLQCGYCTPGMVLSAFYLLSRNPHPSEFEIRRSIAGNICRCTGYQGIVDSIQKASEKKSSTLT